MEILIWKIVFSIFIFLAVALLGCLPISLAEYFRSRVTLPSAGLEGVLSALNSFAGGVFLATCMLELLPEARDTIISVNFDVLPNYPTTELIVILGVVVLLVTEICIEYFTGKLIRRETEGVFATDMSGTPNDDISRSCDYSDDDKTILIPGGEKVTPSSSSLKTGVDDESAPLLRPTSVEFNIRLMALVGALSVHSIFDGVAIGVQTDVAFVTEVFVAIMIHKSVFALSLGVRLAEHRRPEEPSTDPVYRYLLCFASSTPFGIALGSFAILVAGGVTGAASIMNGVLQSLAAGTLMYVTFIEILPEAVHSQPSIARIVSLLLGIGTIAFTVGYFQE